VTNDAPVNFPLGNTTVTWTVTDNSGNTASATQVITVTDNESPVIADCGDTILTCVPAVTFTLPSASDNCAVAAFSQTDLTGLTSGSDFPDGYTTLSYTAVDISGNTTGCTKVIKKVQVPGIKDAGEDKTVYISEAIMNAVPDTAGIGWWSVLSGSAFAEDVNAPDTRVYGLTKGVNTLTWKIVSEGCPGPEDTVVVTYLDVIVPNGFSPDGDQVNDLFEITGLEELSPAELVVVNRWGTVVYTDAEYSNDWQGLNDSGQNLSDDTYYYKLKLNNDAVLSGFVIIERK
jgi:gliding motility-associated-like protein